MTVNQMVESARMNLDIEGVSGFHTDTDILDGLNFAARLFAMRTLCLEDSGVLPLESGQSWYRLLETFPSMIVPLRVSIDGGQKVLPAKLEELDAENPAFEDAEQMPTRYTVLGFDLLAIDRRPSFPGTGLKIVYAASPETLEEDGQTALPARSHPAIVDGAIWRIRLREGAQFLPDAAVRLARFDTEAERMARVVAARGRASGYDRLPPEIGTK